MNDTISTLTNQSGKPALKIIKLGAEAGANKNMTVYECGDDIIIVDCGGGMPDSDVLGVDTVIPDITYLLERKHMLRAMFITHAHFDHYGAVPYLIDELKVPIYSNDLAIGYIRGNLKERFPNGGEKNFKLNVVGPESPKVTFGNFSVEFFGVNHSVPSSMGLAIKTPQGTVMHAADYKIDWTPVIDKPIQLGRIANYGEAGVLCLLSDCLGVNTDGYTKSEKTLDHTFRELYEKAEGRQLIITILSSNISRMYQIIQGAIKHGRKISVAGRSIDQSVTLARELGYLPFPPDVFVNDKAAVGLDQSKLVYIITGCYGQQGSALDRLSRGEHNTLKLAKNSLVMFSADPHPPGVQEAVEKLLHNLTVAGAEIIYSEIQDNLHVGGHGLHGDLLTVTALSKAKYYVPIGGTAAKMRSYTNLVGELGRDKKNVFELLEGESVIFNNNEAKKGDKIEIKPVYIAGRKMQEVDPIVVKDREQLSNDGVFVVVIPINKKGSYLPERVEIVSRGFVYMKDSQELMGKVKQFVRSKLTNASTDAKDWGQLKRKMEHEINRMLYKELGREPLTIVHILEI